MIEQALLIKPGDVIRNKVTEKNQDPSFGAWIPYIVADGKTIAKAFRLLFDRSVEKVRIYSLLESLCRFHAEWEIPVPRPKTDEDLTPEEELEEKAAEVHGQGE